MLNSCSSPYLEMDQAMMINPPHTGMQKSATLNNTDPNAVADWIETSVLFGAEVVSDGEIVDILEEQQVATPNDDGAELSIADMIISDARAEIKNRVRYTGPMNRGGGGYILTERRRFGPVVDRWEEDPIRAFLLILSMFRRYPDWVSDLKDYTQQGELFERVCEALLQNLFTTWTVKRVGWSPDDTQGIIPIIQLVSDMLNSSGHAEINKWVSTDNKDGGLDLVAVRRFEEDPREGLPAYLIQCASGANWRSKIATPSISSWHKWLDTAVEPSAGLTAPFVISKEMLAQAQLEGHSIVLDRLRLLNGYYGESADIDTTLLDDVVAWCRPYVDQLPWLEVA